MQQLNGEAFLDSFAADPGAPPGGGFAAGPASASAGEPAADEIDFAKVFDALTTPYMVLDAELRYVAANAAYEEATFRTREELLGQRLFDLFPNPGESGRRLRRSLEQVMATGEPDTIAFLSYAIPRPASKGGGMEQRYWSATHSPVKDALGKVRFIVQNTVDVTEIVRLREANALPFRTVPGELALLKNAQDVEEAYQERVSESEEFRQLFRQAPGMIAVLEGEDQVFTFVNDSYQRFVGERDLIGRPLHEALPEICDQGFAEMVQEAYREGRQVSGEAVPTVIRADAGVLPKEAFVDFTCNPIRDGEGAVIGVFVQGADRTEAVRATKHQRTLIDELNHRVKNTLATIQAMARQSFRNTEDIAEARYAFESRLMALSHAHNILSDRRWEFAPLSALLKEELADFGADRVSMVGPEITLPANVGISLAIVFHELTANAQRHGALKDDAGSLEVIWSHSTEPDGQTLAFSWTEQCRRSLAEAPGPLRPGYGIRVLTRIIEGELVGSLSLDLQESGLICRFVIKLSEVGDIAGSGAQ
ncbi:sensor histidine kinase [Aurantimonas sp. VKM B-3413]|uniref:sensor histidine kinase n=1 Tax=Aurantimonas sp. VKM B-3413 TaxID=2779401 RepID=UPI001E338DAC|nr:PAS domain-containing protein [Aurantimonas sp. VKM B-3413]MCB8836529.1 PAS domain-containing protein [Aurantimonas sp. VKM B-3413]